MQDDRTAVKRCIRCGETKPLTTFWADYRKPDGRQTRCAECANKRRTQTRLYGPPPKGPMYLVEDRGYDTSCWIWQRALDRKGYGVINRAATGQMLAHRWMYLQHGGAIPEARPLLDHLCRVTACVNPAHLEPVTNRENLRRGRGTKLSDADVLAIRASGEPAPALARRYGVGTNYIYALRAGDRRQDAA